MKRTYLLLILLVVLSIVAYWLLPIPGQVTFVFDESRATTIWPQIRFKPDQLIANQPAIVSVTDVTPWSNVQLSIAGQAAQFLDWQKEATAERWTWRWTFTVPDRAGYPIVFYHDCDSGCRERARITLGSPDAVNPIDQLTPTKLCAVFAHPQRDWHGRSGWAVELTYATQAGEDYWNLDDLAARVQQADRAGLNVLVRVDYDPQQSLPPLDDFVALDRYLQFLRRLARDDRFKPVQGFIIGSGYNTQGGNALTHDRAVTPEWYARVFSGYGAEASHADNVVQVIRAENSTVQILVGPVRPWNTDQNGSQKYRVDAAWLNYFNTLVAALAEAAQNKAAIGLPNIAPSGFAVQAPGRPEAVSIPADEPRLDLVRAEWQGAQAGFRVYRDWLDIVNAHEATRGLPVYITSSNTFTPDTNVPPAQNYPVGWLTTALDVINHEPQIKSLCWFIDDFSHDQQWDFFSLTKHPGRLIDAAEEFDQLLQTTR
ncbi:hypothetical protein TFLX_00577 [Thermoflexales bacterium]|nr:hypothetical protein TFLX_00577 [Thermoflexales bacterium]